MPTKRAKTTRKTTRRAKTAPTATRRTKKQATRTAPPRRRESQAARQARAKRLVAGLRQAYPDAGTALDHRSAYELLVATILSAQCTDQRVNMVTPDLFRRYPAVDALAAADQAELEAAIRTTGFYRNKAKSLLGMARQVCDEHDGAIPDTMEALVKLPGVARKTANCVLGTWYRRNEGIVVDTHVGRIAVRLGLAPTARDGKDAERVERDLMAVIPRDDWTYLAHALILHGRQVCTARDPKCEQCPLAADCPSAGRL